MKSKPLEVAADYNLKVATFRSTMIRVTTVSKKENDVNKFIEFQHLGWSVHSINIPALVLLVATATAAIWILRKRRKNKYMLKKNIPLFQVAEFQRFDKGEKVSQHIEGEYELIPHDLLECEAGQNIRCYAEVVKAQPGRNGWTYITIKKYT